jgi:hypothetical protein
MTRNYYAISGVCVRTLDDTVSNITSPTFFSGAFSVTEQMRIIILHSQRNNNKKRYFCSDVCPSSVGVVDSHRETSLVLVAA